MPRVGRGIRYLAAWSASTTVAVALSWLGVRSVLEAGVPLPPRVVAGPVQETATVVTTTTTEAPPPAPTTTEPPTTTTTTTTTTVPPPTKTTPPPPADGAWTEDDGKPAYVRSFQLAGGEAAVQFSPNGTDPISATPRQGFAVSVKQPDGTLVIEFQSPNHRSRLEASWAGGPRWKIIEAG
jgi:hypothetical protein